MAKWSSAHPGYRHRTMASCPGEAVRVELSEARGVVDDIEFTIAGEAHTASFWERPLWQSLIDPRG